MEKVKVDTETTGHGMIFGPTLEKVNQVYNLMRNSAHDSRGDGPTSFGLEARTPTMEEAQNKERGFAE